MNNEEKILDLYYNQHLKQKDIAVLIGVSKQYISKIVNKDTRNDQEKQIRKDNNNVKRKDYMKEYFKNYIRNTKGKENMQEYYNLLAMINRDNRILSTKLEMSDIAFAEWNRSIYDYAEKRSDLVLKKDVNVTFDVPQVVRNLVNASSIRSNYKINTL